MKLGQLLRRLPIVGHMLRASDRVKAESEAMRLQLQSWQQEAGLLRSRSDQLATALRQAEQVLGQMKADRADLVAQLAALERRDGERLDAWTARGAALDRAIQSADRIAGSIAGDRRKWQDLLLAMQNWIERRGDDGSVAAAVSQAGVPALLRAWEGLYDPASGGWFAPGWLETDQGFSAVSAESWRSQYGRDYPQGINYAPVELEVANFYYWFCMMARPRLVLETGTNMGYSTSMIAAALARYSSDGHVFTIDMRDGQQLFRETELTERITFLHGSSLEVVVPIEEPFDLLVLDSDHTFGTVMQELVRFEPQLKVGGHILMHDSLFFDGVGLAVIELMRNPRFEVMTLRSPRTHLVGTRPPGLSIIRKIADVGAGDALSYDPALATVGVDMNPSRNPMLPSVVDLHHRGERPAPG